MSTDENYTFLDLDLPEISADHSNSYFLNSDVYEKPNFEFDELSKKKIFFNNFTCSVR